MKDEPFLEKTKVGPRRKLDELLPEAFELSAQQRLPGPGLLPLRRTLLRDLKPGGAQDQELGDPRGPREHTRS